MDSAPVLAVIGGSGLYHMGALQSTESVELDTPFGKPSAPIILGELEGRRVAFLARHGIGHTIPPGRINFRANLYALKQLGVQRVVSVNACGSLREDYSPGDIVIPDQVFDFTRERPRSFFDTGLVAHVSTADPFCPQLSALSAAAVVSAGGSVHAGGNFIIIEGPRFSTRLESNVFRSWGMTIIGMTTCPEVFLAREAELCYAVMAHVTDYDVWHTSEKPVTVEMVIEVLNKNTHLAQEAIKNLVRALPPERDCACDRALADARITAPHHIDPETLNRVKLLLEKYAG